MAVNNGIITHSGSKGNHLSAQEDGCSDSLLVISDGRRFSGIAQWLDDMRDNACVLGENKVGLTVANSEETICSSSDIVELQMPAADDLEQELWEKAERIMLAKHMQVMKVLEDFGIADVKPATDIVEEQLWQAVQGEITFQEPSDLV